jgi:hypothetical protein
MTRGRDASIAYKLVGESLRLRGPERERRGSIPDFTPHEIEIR